MCPLFEQESLFCIFQQTLTFFFLGEAESRLDDLIKSLQKGSADLMKAEDAMLTTFKQVNDAENIKGQFLPQTI